MDKITNIKIQSSNKSNNENEFFQRGYTLIETLVASAILLGVLIPAILFFGKVAVDQKAKDLVIASQLAGEEIEKTIAFNQYRNDEKTVKLNNATWRISRRVKNWSGLIEIRVRVFKRNQSNSLVELKTLRVLK